MSVAALRLIHCRRLSTAGPPGVNKLLQWKHLRKIGKITGAVIFGGCLFVTYEVVALDKAVTIDTSAILQEKYKSYIYLRATPSAENENITAGNDFHLLRLSSIRLRCFRHLSYFPDHLDLV
ncbi:hypothetical protein ATANTOWER_015407 [Ataeniobius toweri]|uniref:Uncharacterized protein n=1 Tax=Ataeniobius toweri TaxID=208326 RepID=A0ABU7AG63_9TELE|nr:hypothetical protein [Ataeniobius toweri]